MDTTEFKAMRPALRYFGGKWRAASWIVQKLPPHKVYVELFGGSAAVLLKKNPVFIEVYNDLSQDVVNFFRILRDHSGDLIRLLQLTPYARDEYESCAERTANGLENARRFFVRSWCSRYASSYGTRGWRRSRERDLAGNVKSTVEALSMVSDRLRDVVVENKPWRDVLYAYDSRETCFYADPPYLSSARSSRAPSNGYGTFDLSTAEHRELCAELEKAKGSALLSGYSSAEYGEWLSDWSRYDKGKECLWKKP